MRFFRSLARLGSQHLATPRRRFAAMVALGGGLLVGSWAAQGWLGTGAPPPTMPFSELAAAIERKDVGEATIHANEAEIVLRNGERWRVEAPIFAQPTAQLSQSGAKVSFDLAEGTVWGAVDSIFEKLFPLAMLGVLLWQARSSFLPARAFTPSATQKVTFDDVAGQAVAKEELGDIVAYLKDPKRFEAAGAKPCRGVLLAGPTGTGKTLLARALAGEAGVPFLHASGSKFVQMFVGVGAARVRRLFADARKRAPCIIFIDEFDALARSRGRGRDSASQEHDSTVNELLAEMDGIESREGVVVIAASNFADTLDAAILRPGRFDRKVLVDNPEISERLKILEIEARNKQFAPDVDFEMVARGTPGMNGAEVAAILNEAAIRAARDGRVVISRTDVAGGYDRSVLGAERRGIRLSDDDKVITSFHEAGHALTAIKWEGADPLLKVTIVPRGPGLGLAVVMPDGTRHIHTRKALLARLAICYGGRVAEELCLGRERITAGAKGDYREATKIATAMVYDLGLGDEEGDPLPPLAWSTDPQDGAPVSGRTRDRLDAAVEALAIRTYAAVKALLTENMAGLEALAGALLERETLEGAEAVRIVADAEADQARRALPWQDMPDGDHHPHLAAPLAVP